VSREQPALNRWDIEIFWEIRRKVQKNEGVDCAIGGRTGTFCKDRTGHALLSDCSTNERFAFIAVPLPFRGDEDRTGGSAIASTAGELGPGDPGSAPSASSKSLLGMVFLASIQRSRTGNTKVCGQRGVFSAQVNRERRQVYMQQSSGCRKTPRAAVEKATACTGNRRRGGPLQAHSTANVSIGRIVRTTPGTVSP